MKFKLHQKFQLFSFLSWTVKFCNCKMKVLGKIELLRIKSFFCFETAEIIIIKTCKFRLKKCLFNSRIFLQISSHRKSMETYNDNKNVYWMFTKYPNAFRLQHEAGESSLRTRMFHKDQTAESFHPNPAKHPAKRCLTAKKAIAQSCSPH